MKTLQQFLRRKGFAVMTGKPKGPQEYEAWAYQGSLDFNTATPECFGLGDTPVSALAALDWQLEKRKTHGPPASNPVCKPPAHSQQSLHAHVNRRELATILAALRYHQDENLQAGPKIADLAIRDIATDGGAFKPLSCREIDALCVRLNAASEAQCGLHIEPPPAERSDGTLHRVVYIIDVNAANPRDAAEQVQQILSDPDSLPPVLHIINWRGRSTTIDLAHP